MSTPDKATKDQRARVREFRVLRRIAYSLIAIVLVAGGFYGGRLIGLRSHQTAQPTVTVTVTSPASGAPTLSPSPSPAGSSGASSSASPAATSSSGAGTASNGKQLGSYSVKIPPGYSVPLGAAAPTQAQFTANGSVTGDDLYFSGSAFQPANNDKMLMLPNGVVPTYQKCVADTVFIGSADATPGTAFCIIGAAAMVGVTVKSFSSAQTYVLVHATVWKNIS